MEIYSSAREFMASQGNPKQWGATNWPPEALIRKDIKAGDSYVCIDGGQIVGTFYFVFGEDIDPTYRVIEGKWLSDTAYGVVHRIATDRARKGVGSFCIDWAYKKCGHLRIDTHEDNMVMKSLLKKMGFSECGIIYVKEDNDPRIAYEKV